MEGFAAIVGVILWLIALAESITADESQVRNLPKMFWIFLVLFTFDIGAILWFVCGRPRGQTRSVPYKGNTGEAPPARGRRGAAPVGPDDDPRFLDSLKADRLQSWEDDLLRRERELRRSTEDEGDEPTA